MYGQRRRKCASPSFLPTDKPNTTTCIWFLLLLNCQVDESRWTLLQCCSQKAALRQHGTCMHYTIQYSVIKTLRKMLDKMQLYLDQPWLPWQGNLGVKIDNNSGSMRDISKILASNKGFSGSGYLMMSVKFYRDRPLLPWQRILSQNCHGLYERYLLAKVFRAELLKDVSQILPRNLRNLAENWL